MDERRVLERAAALGIEYVESLDTRPVRPVATIEELRARFDVPLPDGPTDPVEVIEQLARNADAGLTATGGGRYFGFVVGGAVPAALAADWLAAAWDQNAGLALLAPSASVAEEVAGRWMKDLLGIPESASFALVTGCQMAHATALVAARHHVLAAVGYDVETDGLSGAPAIRVVTGAKRHGTVDRALRFVGLGTGCVRLVPADDQGRMVAADLPRVLAESDAPTIVIAQLGEVNTGACDDLEAIADACEAAGAWLHVDAAFGLWAAAAPSLAHLTAGSARADSWATDAHKWLNVPYDVGVTFCAHPESHSAALGIRSVYLTHSDPAAGRDPLDWTPEHSRRARGFSTYAALRSLGRAGIAELVETTCARARALAAALAELPGCEILNDVVLNQVLFRFEDDEATDAFIAAVQDAGEAWLGGTLWDDRRAVRLSVSCWRTSEDDVVRAAEAFAAARTAHAVSQA